MLVRKTGAKGEFQILVVSWGAVKIMGVRPRMRTHSFFFFFLISCQFFNEIGGREGANSQQSLKSLELSRHLYEDKAARGGGGCHCDLEAFPLANITPLGFGSEPR